MDIMMFIIFLVTDLFLIFCFTMSGFSLTNFKSNICLLSFILANNTHCITTAQSLSYTSFPYISREKTWNFCRKMKIS